jgi:transposase
MWIPPEDKDPILLHAPTRKSVAVLGAVRHDDGRLVVLRESAFNADTFLSFLRSLLRHRRRERKVVVVLDNARWHHARALQPWLHRHRKSLMLLFLPPYSPDLNPMERVWKLTRRQCTHNHYFPDLSNLMLAVTKQFRLWQRPNQTLRRLCAII